MQNQCVDVFHLRRSETVLFLLVVLSELRVENPQNLQTVSTSVSVVGSGPEL